MTEQGIRGRLLRAAAVAVRPYIWRELPGWGRLVRLVRLDGIDNRNPYWSRPRRRVLRGKLHGLKLHLDLSNDLDRMFWALGRYYDQEIQLALCALLRPGDTCVDIGANVGHFAALAAHLVGPSGRVLAFEPNPDCFARLEWLQRENALAQLELFPVALGDRPDRAALHLLGGDTILGTLAPGTAPAEERRGTVEVAVEQGDTVLGPRLPEEALIKIDVEGYEMQVLRGLAATIAARRPRLIVEMSAENLARAGSGCAELAEFLRAHGYRAFRLGTARAGFGRQIGRAHV